MQALTPSVFPCYAAADRAMAARIAEFLERGADVRVLLPEGELREGEDLAIKAREARMADIVLVLFSRNSLQSRWPRSQWEDALIHEPAAEGVRIGFVKWDDCSAPKVLAPMFVCEAPALRGLRRLKRWVRGRDAAFQPPAIPGAVPEESELEITGIAVADRPGSEYVESVALAYEFVRAYRGDFDEVFRLECAGRSVAAVAGDLAAQLGLRLEGDLESNLDRLRDFCAARRFLLLLEEGGDTDDFFFGGRCSTLLIGESGPSTPDPLGTAQRVVAELSESWEEICAHARIGRRITRDQGRMAECFELMTQWHDAAEARNDRTVLDESAREIVWILESWGRNAEAARLEQRRASEYDEQMSLF